MSWGVATQNGVSVSLASIVSLSCGATEFSPASLFTTGVTGAWYDPSDYSTLFQDSADTTPVTAVEQPVGLMLDKSQGLALGSELITPVANQDFSSDTGYWTKSATTTIGSGKASLAIVPDGTYALIRTGVLTIGKVYTITIDISDYSTGEVVIRDGAVNHPFKSPSSGASNGTKSVTFLASGNSVGIRTIGITTLSVDNISVKEIAGNHASQATAASRPVLRARYNLLTYSEQFDNAAWVKSNFNAFGSGSVANTTATTDPIDGNTADFLQLSTAANVIHNALIQPSTSASTVYTQSIYVKAAGYSKVGLREGVSTGAYATADLSTGSIIASGAGASGAFCTSVGNGWYRIGFTFTSGAGATSGVQVFAMDSGYASGSPAAYTFTANGTDGIYIWGADLRTGLSAGTYQRIAAATDYATAGFLPYLALDGTDDSFGTNSIDFSATDKMSVCAGVTKLSDATAQTIVELSSVADTNNGAFWVRREYGYLVRSGGGTNTTFTDAVTAPSTNVITLISDFAAPLTRTRVNGVSGTTSATPSGGGNFGNYPLYIGRRNNATLPFNGRIYQLIVCGKTLSASELASTEAYVNQKTGAY